MFLRILESDDSVFDHRMLVLEVFARLCQDSYTVVELFINYDCDVITTNIFEEIVIIFSIFCFEDNCLYNFT